MTTPANDTTPQLPELPLGLAAACGAFAAVCGVANLHDRAVLVGFFLAAAAALLVTAAIMKRRQPTETGSSTTH